MTHPTPAELDWRQDAACREVGPEVMTADQPSVHDLLGAKRACDSCPVLEQCRQAARGEYHGMWAGEWRGPLGHALRTEAFELLLAEGGSDGALAARLGVSRRQVQYARENALRDTA